MKQSHLDREISKNGANDTTRRSQRPADADTCSSVIPRNRDKRRNPVPRRIIFTPPLVSLDEEALTETAEAFARSPEEGARNMPRLYAMNAIRAKEKARELEENLIAAREERNREATQEIEKLQPLSESLQETENGLAAVAAKACAVAKLAHRPDAETIEFAHNEPASLEEIAGTEGLLAPEYSVGWWNRLGYKLLAVLGAGSLFGISIGGLVADLDFSSLTEKWLDAILWITIGMVLFAIMGALLYPIAKHKANELYNRGVRLDWVRWTNLACAILLIIGIAYALIRIESHVEKEGLFAAINANESRKGTEVPKEDLEWIALMLVFPVVFLYINLGLAEGLRVANLTRLMALQRKMRQAIMERSEFAEAVRAHNEYRSARKKREKVDAKIAHWEAQIRHELTEEERLRIEDVQHDAIGQDLEAQAWLQAVALSQGYGPRNWWRRLKAAFRRT